MNSLFYWTGAILWTLLAAAVGGALGVLACMASVALARTCSVLRFITALRRKGAVPFESGWGRAVLWIFKEVWDCDSAKFIGRDGSRWSGIGKWSVNDAPWPTPQPQSQTAAE